MLVLVASFLWPSVQFKVSAKLERPEPRLALNICEQNGKLILSISHLRAPRNLAMRNLV